MPKTYAERLARRLLRAAREGCELSKAQARLLKAAAAALLVQGAIIHQKARQARVLSRRLAVAREDRHQLRRTTNHLRRRLCKPGIVLN